MIVHRLWTVAVVRKSLRGLYRDTWHVNREGWFLLGLVPLYIRDLSARKEQ
jgi:hypothetical protein